MSKIIVGEPTGAVRVFKGCTLTVKDEGSLEVHECDGGKRHRASFPTGRWSSAEAVYDDASKDEAAS